MSRTRRCNIESQKNFTKRSETHQCQKYYNLSTSSNRVCDDLGNKTMSALMKGVCGGTPTGDPLCRTCRNCFQIAGQSASENIILCQKIGKTIPFEAMECSEYDDKRVASRWDMEQIAWILMSDAHTKKVGFLSQEELRKRGIEPEDLPPPR